MGFKVNKDCYLMIEETYQLFLNGLVIAYDDQHHQIIDTIQLLVLLESNPNNQ